MAAKKKSNNRNNRNRNSRGRQRSAGEGKNPIIAEVIFWIVLVLSLFIMISLFGIGGIVGDAVSSVIFGLFGAVSFIFPILLVLVGGLVILNAENEMIRHKIWYGLGFYLTLCGIVQWFFNSDVKNVWETYAYSSEHHTRGGFFGGLLSFELSKLLGSVGDMIFLIGLLVLFFILFSRKLLFQTANKKIKDGYDVRKEKRARVRSERISREKEKSVEPDDMPKSQDESRPAMQVHTFEPIMRQEAEAHATGTDVKKDKKNKKSVAPDPMDLSGTGDDTDTDDSVSVEKPSRKKEPGKTAVLEQVKPDLPETDVEKQLENIHINGMNREDKSSSDIFEKELEEKFGKHEEAPALAPDPMKADPLPGVSEVSAGALHDMDIDRLDGSAEAETAKTADVDRPEPKKSEKESTSGKDNKPEDPVEAIEKEAEKPVVREIPYVFPSLDLLTKPKSDGKTMSEKELKETALNLKNTLESFHVGVSLGDISVGPSVTRYELIPDQGVKVKQITGLADDIKLSLAASDIRIEAPIPGKSAVGIEVPNSKRVTITLRELLESDEFQNAKSKVTFAVGKDISGKTIVTDIAKMPHLLVAGSTGSGKSVLINTLIMSIIYKANPNDVKLIMVDPKMVEFMAYAEIPHLMIPVVEDPKKASAALAWGVAEMEKRYKKFSELGVRDLEAYNNKIKKVKDKNDPDYQRMPQIVIIVDEFADLMMVASKDVEASVVRLAQKARAAGIHLVLATQRPSVDVITGIIKANVPSRIALSVSSQIDSRTIIDSPGAEKLLGNGDMLFAPVTLPEPIRVQGAFVSDDDRDKVVAFLKENGGASYDDAVTASIETVQAEAAGTASSQDAAAVPDDGRDEYFAEAGRFIIEKNKASIGALQRAFRIGFNRAARIMDQLSDAGVVGPEEGTKARAIIMDMPAFDALLAGDDGADDSVTDDGSE